MAQESVEPQEIWVFLVCFACYSNGELESYHNIDHVDHDIVLKERENK